MMKKSYYKLKRPFNHFLQWGLAFRRKHVFLKNLIDEISNNYKFYKNKILKIQN